MSSLLDTFYKTIQALRSDATSAAVFVATVVVTCSLFFWLTKDPPLPTKPHTRDEDPEPPRNFTLAQLKEFVGKIEDKEAPIYLALDGEVYDVSEGRDFYGPEGVYGSFAGHDVTKAFAKNSLEESDLDVEDLSDLTYSEKESLHGWIEKYKYFKQYPVVGRLVKPPTNLKFTVKELAKHKGTQPVPEGYAAAPIYVAVKGTVFDMSFGGLMFYGPGGPYHFLAGNDGSRPLAKMSFEKADAESRDLSDLTDRQKQTLDEWIEKFTNGRKYPVVGKLVD